MFSFEIKNGKVIFQKQGVYFAVPIEDFAEFVTAVNEAKDLINYMTE